MSVLRRTGREGGGGVLRLFREKLSEVLRAVLPLVATVSVLQAVVVHAPAALFLQFLAGSTLAVLGMMLFFVGIEMGILPMGRYIGSALPAKRSIVLIVAVAFALGFATTAAEPDVLVLASQVEAASGGTLRAPGLIYVISGGVGALTALALLRVILGIPLVWVLAVLYVAMITLSLVAPAGYVPLAYDAGSVTTGVLTASVVLAFAVGFSSVLAQRSTVSDGFGLLGLGSIGPILALLALGILAG